MSKTITAQGSYEAPTGEDISFDFTYEVLDPATIQELDAIYAGAGKCTQRMLKLDAGNTAREKAKVDNGHSTRKPMTEEQKAQAKVSRQADKEVLAILKSKGLTLKDLMEM